MVFPLDVLWFVLLTLSLAVLSTAHRLGARVFWALMLLIIVAGLALTAVSMLARRRVATQEASEQAALVEYLKSHGIGGDLSELAQSLGITEEKAMRFLLTLEQRGTIPAGSTKAFASHSRDSGET
jgi:hypothetical protein